MKQTDLIVALRDFLRVSLPSAWKIESDHTAHIRLDPGQAAGIELKFDPDSIDLRFGLAGELLEFEDYESDKELFESVLKLIREIETEERVSVRYKWLFLSAGGIYTVAKMKELAGKRGFECRSWNGTYDSLRGGKPAERI